MNWRSLQFRLLAGAIVWIAIALLLAGLFIYQVFLADLDRHRQEDLDASLTRLIAGTTVVPTLFVDPQALPDSRFEVPLSGLYWQVRDTETGAVVSSRSLWDGALMPTSALGAAGQRLLSTITGPGGESLVLLSRQLRLESPSGLRSVVFGVAEQRDLRDPLARRFGTDVGLALLAVGFAVGIAAWLQVRLGLQPLRKLRSGLEAVRLGETPQLAATYPHEVLPLVRELNSLLLAHEDNVVSARRRAADLAHSLKTPLSVLRSTAEKLHASGDDANAAVVDQLCEEMLGKVTLQLRLARLRQRNVGISLSASLTTALIRTVAMLRKISGGEAIHWRLALDADISVDMDQHDVMELVGILLDNAAKWANSEVTAACYSDGKSAMVTIADDGPGLSIEQIALIGQRGVRLDETRPGDGLGLAIAKEIIALNRGEMQFHSRPGGGLEVRLKLPLENTDRS
ncbi:MAG: hypothetical protein JWR75_227 [Devosia sp.]|nr:hypothetical protein [Devosia sp.]